MKSTLNESVQTKGSSIDDFTTKVKTDFRTIPFTNLAQSGKGYKDSVDIPIYSIELTDKTSGQKSTFMFVGDSRISNPFIVLSESEMFDLSNIPDFEFFFYHNLIDYLQSEIEKSVFLTKGGGFPTPPGYHHCNMGTRYRFEWDDVQGPLISKISWDHWGSPANDSTKICVSTGLPARAGCLSVAVSQLMSYYQYPTSGSYVHPQYNRLVSAPFDWSLMTSVYDPTLTTNSTIKTMIANIHAYVGSLLPIVYDCSGSGGTFESIKSNALTGYSNTGTYIENNNVYAFETDLRNEINNHRPVLLAGGAHAWILDGYKTTHVEKGDIYYCYQDVNEQFGHTEFYDPDDYGEFLYYHCKLGWGPNYDGYFAGVTVNGTGRGGPYYPAKALIGIQK